MAGLPVEKKQRFTWNDYRSWDDGKRWEIVGGETFALTPSPASRHQSVVTTLARELAAFFKGKTCRVFVAPMDVKLSDEDIVQPDLLVVCNPSQIRPTHIEGPPALAIEILSAHTYRHDRVRKLMLYARFGIKEYWIVNPYPSVSEIYILDSGAFRLHTGYEREDTLLSPTFPGLKITLADVFDFPLEPGEEITMIKEGAPSYAVSARD